MTVAVAGGIALAFGVGVALLRRLLPRGAAIVGLVGLGATAAVGLLIRPDDLLSFGTTSLAGSGTVRALAVLWGASGAALVAIEVLAFRSAAVASPALIGLGTAILGLGSTDPGAGVAFLAAGGVATVVAPAVAAGRTRAAVAWRALRAVVISAVVALGVIAWERSPAGPLSVAFVDEAIDPAAGAAIGLGFIGIVVAVMLRTGAIPAHVWAARLVEAIPAAAVPAVLAWGGAAFALVAGGWALSGLGPVAGALVLERGAVAVVAGFTLLMASTAALIHDDIDHVVGYSIVADAGVVLFAFASLDPAAAGPLATWALAYATVKTGLAAWASAIRGRFGARRLSELAGWAHRAPILAVALGCIAVGAVGVPGTAAWAARAGLVTGAVGSPLDAVAVIGAGISGLVIARVFAAGLRRPTRAVEADPGDRAWRRAPRATVVASLVLGLALLGAAVSLGVGSVA